MEVNRLYIHSVSEHVTNASPKFSPWLFPQEFVDLAELMKDSLLTDWDGQQNHQDVLEYPYVYAHISADPLEP